MFFFQLFLFSYSSTNLPIFDVCKSHGRDHKLCIWRLNRSDEDTLSKKLPADGLASSSAGNEPWLLHSLSINALNFCGFALCPVQREWISKPHSQENTCPRSSSINFETDVANQSHVLLVVPNALNTGGIDIFHLPSETRLCTIPSDSSVNTGMVMAVDLFYTTLGNLCLVSCYEEGSVMIHILKGSIKLHDVQNQRITVSGTWERVYHSRPHSQPVLSLSVCPENKDYFITSSADAVIAKHPILEANHYPQKNQEPIKITNTKHAGQQGLRIRHDAKIFATAGWDSKVRVYSCKTMNELAVLKWHKEGCYALAFANVGVSLDEGKPGTTANGLYYLEKNNSLMPKDQHGSLAMIKNQRSQRAQLTHWLAAGSKDGKISLWDIY